LLLWLVICESYVNHITKATTMQVEDEEIVVVTMFLVLMTLAISQLDGRSLRGPRMQRITVRSNYWALMKSQRSHDAYKRLLRCNPASFDALLALLEPKYTQKYGIPGRNTQYTLDHGLAVLLVYYGNGCGIEGDGIGGAAAQLGMSRTVAGEYIKRFELLLCELIHDVIQFPDRNDTAE
jgi:hypothetical protein